MPTQLSLEALRERLDSRISISEQETLHLLEGSLEERQAAIQALYRSRLRETLEMLGRLAASEDFTNQATLDLMRKLSETANEPLPLLDMIKAMGLWSSERGLDEEAFSYLQSLCEHAWWLSQRLGPEYRRLMSYMRDPEIDGALARMVRNFTPPTFQSVPREKKRIALLTSSLCDDSSPSLVLMGIAEGLRSLGNEVVIVSTEYGIGSSVGTRSYQTLEALGFPIECVLNQGTPFEKVHALIKTFEQLQVDVTLFLVTPMDFVAKILSEVGISPSQCMCNMGYEHHCGKFDYVLQSTSPEQETFTAWPGKSKFIGSFAVLESRIKQAVPMERAMFAVPEDAVVLVTHGRVSKCSVGYVRAIGRILAEYPQTMLVLAGPITDVDTQRLDAGLAPFQLVGQRVVCLGAVLDNVPELLTACDIYLDPFPWPGGQSTLEAMWAGLPIVAMQRANDTTGDPNSIGPIDAATEKFLPASIERAAADDIDAYVRIASEYIQDVEKRKRDGALLRSHVEHEYSQALFMERLEHYLDLAVRAHENPLCTAGAIPVSA